MLTHKYIVKYTGTWCQIDPGINIAARNKLQVAVIKTSMNIREVYVHIKFMSEACFYYRPANSGNFLRCIYMTKTYSVAKIVE